MSNKKNKINNPLKGIPIKSLIITLVMILLFIAFGFAIGFCVRGEVDYEENQALTAYAEASSVSSEDYTSFAVNFYDPGRLRVYGVSFTFLNHSLSVYPDNSIPVFSLVALNPVVDVSSMTLGWSVGSNLSRTVSYSEIINPSTEYLTFPFGGPYVDVQDFSVSASSGTVSVGGVLGNLEGDWELLRIEGFYNSPSPTMMNDGAVNIRAVYNNGFSFVTRVSFTSSVIMFSSEQFTLFYNASSNFVFYNISETGLTAEAYERGKLAGMSDTEDLVREARLEGYNNGRAEGEDIGYQRGLDTALEDISPFNVIVSGVNSFLRTEILPGVQLTIILSVGFGLLLLGFAIKIFLGG